MIEKAIAAALEPLADELVELSRRVDAIQIKDGAPGEPGAPGRDADPADVARLLWQDAEFCKAVKGERGEPGPAGKDGADAPPVEVDVDEVAAALKADGAFIESVRGLPGSTGEAGKDGAPGAAGAAGRDGAGLDAPIYKDGHVYREGVTVIHNAGQYFRALRDTAGEPGDSPDWQRVGTAGTRWRGLKPDPATLVDGDEYIDNGSQFRVINGKATMVVQRGMRGDRGEKGDAGPRGERGADGRSYIDGQLFPELLILAADDGSTTEIPVQGFAELAAMAEQVRRFAPVLEALAGVDPADLARWIKAQKGKHAHA